MQWHLPRGKRAPEDQGNMFKKEVLTAPTPSDMQWNNKMYKVKERDRKTCIALLEHDGQQPRYASSSSPGRRISWPEPS